MALLLKAPELEALLKQTALTLKICAQQISTEKFFKKYEFFATPPF
tara:strand:- start:3280 stop:3417 length:138 start_codon:yes stop_codon:yes gene_type:complete